MSEWAKVAAAFQMLTSTLCSEKNTHSHFLLYPGRKYFDL